MNIIDENSIEKLETMSCDIEQVIKVLNVFMEFCTNEGSIFEDGDNVQEAAFSALIFAKRVDKFRSILYTAEKTLCNDMAALDEVIAKGIQAVKQI